MYHLMLEIYDLTTVQIITSYPKYIIRFNHKSSSDIALLYQLIPDNDYNQNIFSFLRVYNF